MSAVDRGVVGNMPVSIYSIVSGKVVPDGSASVISSVDEDRNVIKEPRRILHGHELENDNDCDNMVVRTVIIVGECKKERYPYTFRTNDDIPETLGDINTNGVYVWDSQEMKPVLPKSVPGIFSKTKKPNDKTDTEIIAIIDDNDGLSKESTKDCTMYLTKGISVNFKSYIYSSKLGQGSPPPW